MDIDTITAIATAPGRGGIGIVRLSGPQALSIARKLFHTTAHQLPESSFDFPAHRLIHGTVADFVSGKVIDEALMAYMPAPHSYTKEEVVELQLHGSPIVLGVVLNATISAGARLAEPGEFTRRAFLNGRLDLTQAEAVADLINAQSESAYRSAISQLTGALSQKIAPIIEALTHVHAEIEASIEFGEDVAVDFNRENLRSLLAIQILPRLHALADSYQQGQALREGLRLAIVGRPNVGKSSLLNTLLNQERAIVTPMPGTTRDTIEAPLIFDGYPIVAIDTAGIHPSNDPVESIGVQKAQETLAAADLVLLVVEAQVPFGPDDSAIWEQAKSKPTLLVINKIDLIPAHQKIAIPPDFESLSIAKISALTGEGIDDLKSRIVQKGFSSIEKNTESVIITQQRHKHCLDKAISLLEQTVDTCQQGAFEELLVMDLQSTIRALNQLLGKEVSTDVLDTIFQRFCIGK
ncbi:MAG: tRNA uridine-5-carboxymethylaminomethyl(34) synthesis GTPase MnmE [Desulfobacteraceae bacterium]|nr:tRNA uridine-5-carboxymethylaminomethyl(34) synthesis GTPase MnmE [Desulfobacteraceae bacterium]